MFKLKINLKNTQKINLQLIYKKFRMNHKIPTIQPLGERMKKMKTIQSKNLSKILKTKRT